MGMRYKVWLRYGTRGQDTRDIFREVEALSVDHALMLVKSMTRDYSRTFECNVSPVEEAGPERMRFHFDKVYADDSPLMTVKYVYRRIHGILNTYKSSDQLQDLSNFYSELAENYYKVVGEKIGDPYD